jgi:anti-sigma28 factor (negative regulator of flagellin synthesis)
MNIERIHESLPLHDQPLKNQAARKEKQTDSVRKDRVELSPEARNLQQQKDLVELASARLREIPDIRQAKVEEVKGKVASGFYNDEQVIRDVAAHMARSAEFREALAAENQAASQVDPERLKKLVVVMNRVERGFYDSEEVQKKVSGQILSRFLDNRMEP